MLKNVKNLPNYANKYEYIVVRVCDNELWFWGAWNEKEKAQQTAYEIDGLVLNN